MSNIHTVKGNPNHKMRQKSNNEIWSYEIDEPHEHEPWLFPQVIGGFRADHISGVSQTISEIITTVVDEQVIDDRSKSESESQHVIPLPFDNQTESSPSEPTQQPIETQPNPRHHIISTEERAVETQTTPNTSSPEIIAPERHETESLVVSEEITSETLEDNESPHESISETEYITDSESISENETKPEESVPQPHPSDITKSGTDNTPESESIPESGTQSEQTTPQTDPLDNTESETYTIIENESISESDKQTEQTEPETHPIDSTEEAVIGETHYDHEPQRKEGTGLKEDKATQTEKFPTFVESKGTQTERFPTFVESEVLSYVVYYNSPNKTDKPVAVLLGQIMGQTKSGCDEAKHLNVHNSDGKLVMALMDNNDIEVMRDSANVRHRNNIIKICPKDKAKACVYGQTGAGFIFGSDSMIIFNGILLISQNNKIRKLNAGRHLIEPYSGTTKFIICENNECILIHTDNSYLIDDESYLNIKPPIHDKPHDKYHISPTYRKTIADNDGIDSDSPHESVSESFSETISETETESKDDNTKPSSADSANIIRMDKNTKLDFVIYYERKPVVKPVAIMNGRVMGQVFLHQSMKFEYGEFYGQIFLRINDNKHNDTIKDSEFVKNSSDMIIIHPNGDASALIYGEKFGGYIIGSDTTVTIVGGLTIRSGEKFDNITVISGGSHLVEPISGMIKFVIHENTTVLLDCGNSYKIDGNTAKLDKQTQIDLSASAQRKTSENIRSTIGGGLDFMIYYKREKPAVSKAVAYLLGNIDIPTVENPFKHDYPDLRGYLVMLEFLDDNMDKVKESMDIQSANNMVKIAPNNDAKACIFGETLPGFTIDSNAIILISGQLNIVKNHVITKSLPGRYLVEPITGEVRFVIHENTVDLIEEEGKFELNADITGVNAIKPRGAQTSGVDTATQTDSQFSSLRVDRETQTDSQFPSLLESKIISYVLYYRQQSKADRAVAVLLGPVFGQTNSDCNESKHLNIPRIEGKLEMALLDTSDVQLMKDSAIVRHSTDLIKICPADEAKAYIYGQTGAGFVITSDAILMVSGRLLIAENKATKTLNGGWHLVEPRSGVTKFMICANGLCILLHTDGQYKIDDESYLDFKSQSGISDSVSEKRTIGATKPRGDQISRVDRATQTDSQFQSLRVNRETQTDSQFPTLVSSKIVSYVLYYRQRSKEDRAVAVLLGPVFGQTNSDCNESKHMNIPRIEGKLEMALLESSDVHLMKDSAIVRHSTDLIKICPTDEAKAYIYGQTGAGFVITSDAILIVSGRLLIAKNNATKTLSAGRHLVEPRSGVTKFIICANGLCILVHSTGVYKIDGQ